MLWFQVPDKCQNTSTIKVVVQIMAISVPNGYCPVTQTVQMFAESAFTCKNLNKEEDMWIQVEDGTLVTQPMCKVGALYAVGPNARGHDGGCQSRAGRTSR